VGEIAGLGPVAVDDRPLARGDVGCELGDDVRVLAFVFLGTTVPLVDREEPQARKLEVVVVVEVLGVLLAGEFRSRCSPRPGGSRARAPSGSRKSRR
jgi:hypothetical protein